MRILINASIHTLDASKPLVTSLAIENGRVTAVGQTDELESLAKSPRQIENMNGAHILPGFCDAHIHLLDYGRTLSKINCETSTRQECLQRIQQRVQQTPPGKWVLGHGWNHNLWPEGMGNAKDLDEISRDHPIYLTAKSLHAGWANGTALRLADISSTNDDPPGGKIGRDADGQPDGILLESAVQLVESVIPAATANENLADIQCAQDALLAMGVTSIHDFSDWEAWKAFRSMEERGELKLRITKSIPRSQFRTILQEGLHSREGSDRLKIGALKLFSDGALGMKSAAMLEPYENSTDERGMLVMDEDEIFQIGRDAIQHGIALAIHAIGDRANRAVLNTYQCLREFEQHSNLPTLRHRIEHVQLIHPEDQPRLAKLGIIASMQPIHATSDRVMAEKHWGSRCSQAYAWQSLQNHKAQLIFGSDAPVETPNPFYGLYAATTRKPIEHEDNEGWHPKECISLFTAIQCYSTSPAFATGQEHSLGKLIPGFHADLIVLDVNPFDIPPEELIHLTPTVVMSGGKWVINQP
jgi:hypothetical protein